VRAALAGGALAGGGRLDEGHSRQALLHLVDDPAVGGDDVLLGPEALGRLDDAGGRAHRIGEVDHSARGLGVDQHLGLRVLQLELLQLLRLELVVDHAGGVPHEHVGAGRALDVVAQVLVRGPEDLLPLPVQVRHDLLGDRGGHHPVGPCLDRRAGVGVHHDGAVRVGVAEGRELVRRGSEVERALGLQVRHEHALLGVEDLGSLPHEAHARHDDGRGGVLVGEARHLEGVGDRAPGGLREVLEVRMDVVVRHQDGVALAEQLARTLDERRLLGGVDELGGLGGREADVAGHSLEADLDGFSGSHVSF
jgi:hypothetical protein